MRSRRTLILAALLSLALHLSALFSYGPVESARQPDPEGDPVRLEARFVPPSPSLPRHESPLKSPALPGAGVRSKAVAPGPDLRPSALASDAGILAAAAQSSAPAESAQSAVPDPSPGAAEAVQSSPAEARPADLLLDAERIPEQGRVLLSGTAGGFIALQAHGLVSWSHDGEFFESRLAAGLASEDGSFDYRANGRLIEQQLLIENTRDVRRGKVSSAAIEHAVGTVYMSRGVDRRERKFKGLALGLAALPQFLMTLDERIEKSSLFIVGDFWVEDSVLIARGVERLVLPLGALRASHYQLRIPNGKLVDVWLALEWQNAPVRIRIEADGLVLDLRAREVELNGRVLGKIPEGGND